MTAVEFDLTLYNQSLDAFDDVGYVVIPSMLSAELAEEIGEALSSVSREVSEGERWATEREMLPDRRFFDIVTHPRLIEVVRTLIGEDVQNIDFLGVEQAPGARHERGWHLDYPGLGRLRPPREGGKLTPPGMACPLYLQDMTDEMGPLYVIPGSHKRQRYPTPEEAHEPQLHELRLNVPAGSVVCMHGNLWHSGGPNRSERWRRLFTINFAPWWMKRLDHYYRTPLPEFISASDDPFLRQLFGLEQPASTDQGGYDERHYGV